MDEWGPGEEGGEEGGSTRWEYDQLPGQLAAAHLGLPQDHRCKWTNHPAISLLHCIAAVACCNECINATHPFNARPRRRCHPTQVSPFGFLGAVWIALWIVLKHDPNLKVCGLISDNKSIDDAEPLRQRPRFNISFQLPVHCLDHCLDRPEARPEAEGAQSHFQ